MVSLKECCMTSEDMQRPFYSGERIVARGPLVLWSDCFKKKSEQEVTDLRKPMCDILFCVRKFSVCNL